MLRNVIVFKVYDISVHGKHEEMLLVQTRNSHAEEYDSFSTVLHCLFSFGYQILFFLYLEGS